MKQKTLIISTILLLGISLFAQTPALTEAAGWFESVWLKWQPVENADSYNVYYSGEGIQDQKIDDQLIRKYGDYYRADIPGLAAGSYTVTVKPVIGENEEEGVTSGTLEVKAFDRTGFAFSNGRIPGAYNADGTPKANAVVLYITENTKNTVSIEVNGANANPCVGLQTILEGFKKGKDNRPLIVRLIGNIEDPEYLLKGDIVIENNLNTASYITFEGIGDDAVANGWGIRVKNATNIEIRNFAVMNCNSDEGDNISLQQDNDYIWVHHLDLFYGDPGGDSDQAKGDGALDSKESDHVTISYNHFWDTGKSNLLGNGTEDPRYLTYHHNWYDHSDSRHPRVRSHSVHVYNNYYDGNSKYGVGATNASSVFVEANYFRNCKYPILTSMQGSDVYDEDTGTNDYSDMPTFSKEDGGSIKAYNNYMTGQRRFVAYGNTDYPSPTVDFDAYVAGTRDETISNSVISAKGGNTYNNFDTNASVMYSYAVQSPEEAKETVMLYAGRMMGGDFNWSFNDAVDDVSYEVNIDLKNALKSYTTSLLTIQGDGDGTGQVISDTTENPADTIFLPTGDVIHNFTESGLSSSFFAISGNLSETKGTVEFADLTLTRCLKIESSTLISFTTSEEATLTMVFNSDFSGKIRIDDTSMNASNGILSTIIQPGSHEITKDEVCNLFYLSITYANDTSDINGIDDQQDITFSLYPNPVNDRLHVTVNSEIKQLDVYSIAGKLEESLSGNRSSFDLSNLSSGCYLIVLYTENEILRSRIIKN